MAVAPSSLSIGHVGIFVRDFEGMIAFYRDVLGFVQTDKGERICFMSRDPGQHHQVVLAPGRKDGPGETIQQLSFKVASLEDVKDIHDRLVKAGITKIDPCTHGNAWSVYFRDPEGNRLEFYCDTPWHIPQPFRRDMDYSEPSEVIYAKTRAICESVPGYKSMDQYKAELAGRIAGAR